MKRFLTACFLFLSLVGAARAETNAELTRQVNAFVDEWHDDAAHARLAYFDKMAKDGVYIGTDRTELWKRDEFKAWAKKYFDRKSAWSFKATRRNVYASADGSIIWFDELLDTPNMGPCMASGVIRKTNKGFEILHYQLSMAVPNEVNGQVKKLIDENAKKTKS
ncbi:MULTISPECIES: nuclear transport factor 2 family protein [unclassified Massilia]|uniref:nuclear transport factor 2 family protein n=1 Tax=unclassified Massilia TaxID=2609279 RepID=UPI001B832682|nr:MULTISPECIES: nuclear transport factor 2 family protein [unclassified Massilia]MBQ5939242.1 nuclear transport factor 2 family protein [Massilia sp. AB1]MBQ5965579.1 nuclear transport factor 2 family protein [Massilia sp. ZL223]